MEAICCPNNVGGCDCNVLAGLKVVFLIDDCRCYGKLIKKKKKKSFIRYYVISIYIILKEV